MSHGYQAISWNRQKKRIDAVLALGVMAYLLVFVLVGLVLRPMATIETLLIRGLGTAAFVLLHVILAIGPLARLDRRFLPLLYNRRHFGVTLFLLALGHGTIVLIQFHLAGDLHPLVSLLTGGGGAGLSGLSGGPGTVPFQLFGAAALAILFAMAATSHDFWLVQLTPRVWKALHMLVYLAYGLLVAHVAFGVLQDEVSPVYSVLLGAGVLSILTLHLISGVRELKQDRECLGDRCPESKSKSKLESKPTPAQEAPSNPEPDDEGFVDVFAVDTIPEDRARIVTLGGERIAVFRYDGLVSAISNVCRHQNGPLGEGRVIDGCVTCPWHGWQYRPADGASPPPFDEKVPTFRVRVRNGRVLVHPLALPPGTAVPPAKVGEVGR